LFSYNFCESRIWTWLSGFSSAAFMGLVGQGLRSHLRVDWRWTCFHSLRSLVNLSPCSCRPYGNLCPQNSKWTRLECQSSTAQTSSWEWHHCPIPILRGLHENANTRRSDFGGHLQVCLPQVTQMSQQQQKPENNGVISLNH
jgi:hypothetical protein